MAKVAIKSEKLTPLGGIFSIMEQFDSILSSVIDSTLGGQGTGCTSDPSAMFINILLRIGE